MTITWIGIAAGICTALSMLPQLIRLIKEKHSEQISPVAFGILLAGIALWIIYGIKRDDPPLIYTNCLSFLINVMILILGIIYQKK